MTSLVVCPTSPQVISDSAPSTPDCGVGFDTIAVVGPTAKGGISEMQNLFFRRSIDRVTGELRDYAPGGQGWFEVGHGLVRINVRVDKNGGAQMRMETSAPRMMRGSNWVGLPVAELTDTVDYLLRAVAEKVPSVPKLREARFTRLDLTRDFDNVRDVPATLSAIAGHVPSRLTVDVRHHRPDGRLQTLTRGNAHYWRARGYDKTYETGHGSSSPNVSSAGAGPARLRFEVELKGRELQRKGLLTPDCIVNADLTRLVRYYFERCRFNVNTAQHGAAGMLEQLAADGMSPAELRNLVVYLWAEEKRVSPLLTRHALERSRALARRYDIAPGSVGTSSFTRRLDFDLGRETVD